MQNTEADTAGSLATSFHDARARATARNSVVWRVCAYRPSAITVDPNRPGARSVDEEHVNKLAESIRARGLEQAIVIKDTSTYKQKNGAKFLVKRSASLLEGRHRLAAWSKVHSDAPIPCVHASRADDSPAEHKITDELAALEGNALRLELTPEQRAKSIARVAELMREAEPAGGVAANFVSGETKIKKRGRPKKPDSVNAVAAKAGKSRATVARDLRRARGEEPMPKKAAPTSPTVPADDMWGVVGSYVIQHRGYEIEVQREDRLTDRGRGWWARCAGKADGGEAGAIGGGVSKKGATRKKAIEAAQREIDSYLDVSESLEAPEPTSTASPTAPSEPVAALEGSSADVPAEIMARQALRLFRQWRKDFAKVLDGELCQKLDAIEAALEEVH
jgi:hypothetical protein